MDVNFDKLRIRGAKALNSLVNELNGRIDEYEYINISKEGDDLAVGDIYDEIETLREVFATLLSIEDNGIKSIDFDLDVFAPKE